MAIGQVELNTAMSRIQDYATQKHNEDQKGIVDQTNFQTQFKKEITNNMKQVKQGEQAENRNKKFDAREKGNGEYHGDGGRNRKKKDSDGRVVAKQSSGFDMKI